MSRKVRLTREAKKQIRAISNYIVQDSPEYARRWRRTLRERLRDLGDFSGHEIAYTAHDIGRDIRHTFFGIYRILYTLEQDSVVVLTVRHGARRPLTLNEVRKLGE
jgi:plasmid stabilization system protein ParE